MVGNSTCFTKKIYPCVSTTDFPWKTMRYLANCIIAIPIFGRSLGKSNFFPGWPRSLGDLGELSSPTAGGDGSWNLGTIAKDLAFEGRSPPGGESRWGGLQPAVCFLVLGFCVVCLVCVFLLGGRGGGGFSWVFGAVYFFTICLEVSQVGWWTV